MSRASEAGLYEHGRLRSTLLRTHPRFYVGLDLGQAQDHSAIAIVERAELVHKDRDPLTWSFPTETRFHVRHAERIPLGSPYPEIVEHVNRLVRRDPISKHVKVIVDATGVGAPVVDLLRRGGLPCPVIPVVITSGETETTDGVRYRVPKRDLMAGVQVALQRRRLGLSRGMKYLPALVEELRSLNVRTSEDGYERIGSPKRDDLALALALAWWRASREAGVV